MRSVNELRPSRRNVLQTLGLASTGLVLQEGGVGTATAEPSDSTTLLGGFESGADGWKTNGGNDLHVVHRDSFPVGITQGEQGLGFRVDGDPYPILWKTDIESVDFENNPYLTADVLASSHENDAPVIFQFRYHYTPSERSGSSGEGRNKQRGSNSSGRPQLATSEEIRIHQMDTATLYWDMSELSQDALASPNRLDIVWYPADNPPNTKPDGRGSESAYEYEGAVIFDNISLHGEPAVVGSVGVRQTINDLEERFGPIDRLLTETIDDDVETGDIEFADGTVVPYQFEFVGDGKAIYTIDDESFKLGGGWT